MPARILLVWLAILPAPGGATHPRNGRPPRSAMVVWQGGSAVRFVLDPSRDPAVTATRDGRVIWRGVRRHWRPWKLTSGDVDGNGRPEILVGLYKTTRRMPWRHNCVFVYGFDRDSIVARWLGSRLSRPFSDFAVGRLPGIRGDALAALETRLDGRKCVGVYRWNGFGFTLAWERGAWRSARLIRVGSGGVTVVADGKRLVVRRQAQ